MGCWRTRFHAPSVAARPREAGWTAARFTRPNPEGMPVSIAMSFSSTCRACTQAKLSGESLTEKNRRRIELYQSVATGRTVRS
jgi:hypothetical protein